LLFDDVFDGAEAVELGEVARDAVGVRGEVGRVDEGLTFPPGTGELAGAVPEAVQENGESGGGVEGVVAARHDGGEGGRLGAGSRKDGREGAGEMHAMTLHVE